MNNTEKFLTGAAVGLAITVIAKKSGAIGATAFDVEKPIKNITQVRAFFKYFITDLKSTFHPDDDFRNYVPIHAHGNKKSWSNKFGATLNKRMNEAFNVCDREGKDIYEIAISVDKKYNPIWAQIRALPK